MNADRSIRFADDLAAAKHWHEHAPLTKVQTCPRCRGPRTFHKSGWTCGRYVCETCGWSVDEQWR